MGTYHVVILEAWLIFPYGAISFKKYLIIKTSGIYSGDRGRTREQNWRIRIGANGRQMKNSLEGGVYSRTVTCDIRPVYCRVYKAYARAHFTFHLTLITKLGVGIQGDHRS